MTGIEIWTLTNGAQTMANTAAADLDGFSEEYGGESDRAVCDRLFLNMSYSVLRHDINGTKILEMGVGDSVFTDEIIRDYGKSHIVDGSPELLGRASKRYGDAIATYRSYFEDFTPLELFDAVFATFVLEHVDDPVVCLRKASTWLAPDGRLLIMVPNAKSYHRELAVLSGHSKSITELCDTDASVGHKRVYTPEQLESDIEKAGLKILKNENLLFKPLHYGLLRHCNEAELRGLFHMGKMIPNERRAMLYYVCGK